MKPLAFCLLLILAATNIGYSQASVHKLDINSATLFLTAAEVVSTARISVSKGDNEISFTNVAGNINVESIMVSATNGVSVTGITFQNNYLVAENISPKAQELKDSIELMENAKQPLNTKITVLNEQIAILQSNKKVTGDHTGLSVAELQKMLDLVNSKMEGYINEKYKLEQQIKKINDRIARLKSQLDAEQQKGYQPGGKITVKLYAKESTNSSFTVSYITPNAGWTPSYDLWADDTYQPITLYYKAKVHQNCGVDWNNIRLKLSTGNPQEGMNPPTISAWYLEIQKQVVAYKRKSGKNMDYAKSAAAPPSMAGGAWSANASMDMAAAPEEATIDEYVSVDNSGVNTTFDIEIPYTIPTDGQEHSVAIKKHELPATYSHYAVPSKDPDAFSMAKITGWEDLSLLPGETGIFYEGTYVGKGFIDPKSTKDTMKLSIGRDKKIVITRERDKKLRATKLLGSTVNDTYAYTIAVRNTRKQKATIEIEDQMPVSNDKDIVVETIDNDKAEYDAPTGKMKWTLELQPGETKKITFSYSITYPKGKRINGLP